MDQVKKNQIQLQKNLYAHGSKYFPSHEFQEVYKYSLFPPGKLFRPLLALASFLDSNTNQHFTLNKNESISYLCSALEVHHTYTLMHDDLPCMDDDKERRGRPSSHIKFNEWKALLGGDGLLNMSYGLLSDIDHINSRLILKVFSWCLGPKGLIQGQVLDLSGEMTNSFQNIVETHKLKTSRLIQASLVAGSLCSEQNIVRKNILDLARIGEELGILFQFFDDLSELSDATISTHELTINPWLHYYQESMTQTIHSYKITKALIDKNKLTHTKVVIDQYLDKMFGIFSDKQEIITQQLKRHNQQEDVSLRPLMSLF